MFVKRLAAAALCFAAVAAQAAASKWTIVDILPTWGGIAQAINNRGEVTGWMYAPEPLPMHHTFMWSNGELQDLGTPAGHFSSEGVGMSNNGYIVGNGFNGYVAFWHKGEWTALDTRGQLNDVNESGTMVGGLYLPGNLDSHAVMVKDGVITDLGTIGGGGYSFASAINNAGTIVGNASLPTPPFSGQWIFRGFVYENGAMRDIGTLGGTSSYLYDVNSSGMAVGCSDTAAGRLVATVYQNGVLQPLAEIPGNSCARAVNDRGDVIGSSDAGGGWLYSRGTLTMLAQIPEVRAAGYTQLSPLALNDRGWITGTGSKNGGQSFVLIPK